MESSSRRTGNVPLEIQQALLDTRLKKAGKDHFPLAPKMSSSNVNARHYIFCLSFTILACIPGYATWQGSSQPGEQFTKFMRNTTVWALEQMPFSTSSFARLFHSRKKLATLRYMKHDAVTYSSAL